MSRYTACLPPELMLLDKIQAEVKAFIEEEDLDPSTVRMCAAFGFDRQLSGFFAQVWLEGKNAAGYWVDERYLPGLDGMTIGEGKGQCCARVEAFGLVDAFYSQWPDHWTSMLLDMPF